MRDVGSSHDRRTFKRAVQRRAETNAIARLPMDAARSPAPQGKPIDRWLTYLAIAVTIILYLLPKTPLVVIGCLAFIFALLCHPLWNLWWIERTMLRRILALALLAVALFLVGQLAWPKSGGDRTGDAGMPLVRPYDISGIRRIRLIGLLQQQAPKATLRIGCVHWSEAACVAAGRFLLVFSEAGWRIDSGRVFRMESLVPDYGIAVASRPGPGEQRDKALPPHLGMWHRMTPSEITIQRALRELQIKVTGASDSSLPEGTIGVYFGPEPQQPLPMSTAEEDAFRRFPQDRK